jgi:hypothetical protein
MLLLLLLSRHASAATRLSHCLLTFPCSRQAIQKYILANNKLGNLSDTAFRSHVNRAIASGEEKGDFARPKGEYLSHHHNLICDASSLFFRRSLPPSNLKIANTLRRPIWTSKAC